MQIHVQFEVISEVTHLGVTNASNGSDPDAAKPLFGRFFRYVAHPLQIQFVCGNVGRTIFNVLFSLTHSHIN